MAEFQIPVQPTTSGRVLRSRTRTTAPVPVPIKMVKTPAVALAPATEEIVNPSAPATLDNFSISTNATKSKTSVTATPPIPKGSRRTKQKVAKTPSFTESFTGRLDWKTRHFPDPVTSTPVSDKKRTPKSKFTVTNGFGLLDCSSEDEELNISPILKMPAPIIGLGTMAKTYKSPIAHSSRQRPYNKPMTKSKLAMEPPASVPSSSVSVRSIRTSESLVQPAIAALQGGGNSPKNSRKVPILKSKPVPVLSLSQTPQPQKENEIHNFSELLDVYGDDEEAKKELGEFYIDPRTIKRTYPGRKSLETEEKEEENEAPVPVKRSKRTKSPKKVSIRTKKSSVKTGNDAGLIEEAHTRTHKNRQNKLKPSDLEWIEKKRKEFEEIDNFPLKVVKVVHPDGVGVTGHDH